MTRIVMSILLLLCCPLFLAGEFLTRFNQEAAIAAGIVEEPFLFEAGTGHYYFVCLENGELSIKYSPDNGQSFAVCNPDYKGLEFGNISSLKPLKYKTGSWLVFFRAEAAGIPGIYFLQAGNDGTIALGNTETLCAPGAAGIMGAYHVLPAPAGYIIAYNKGSSLGITLLKEDFSRVYLQKECPGIRKLELRMSFRSGGQLYCGLIKREAGENEILDYYEYNGTGLTIQPVISMAKGTLEQHLLVIAPGGAAWLLYLDGGKLYGKAQAADGWFGLNNGNPLSAAAGMNLFNFFIFTDTLYLFGYVPEGNGYRVYGCTVDAGNTVKQMKSGSMLAGAAVEDILSFAPLKDGNILLQYREVVSGNVELKKYNRSTDTLASYPVVIPGSIISCRFIYYRPGSWLLVVNTIAGGKNKVISYEYNAADDSYIYKHETIVYNDSILLPYEISGGNLYLFDTTAGKLVYDAFINQAMLPDGADAWEYYANWISESFLLLEQQGECFLYRVEQGAKG